MPNKKAINSRSIEFTELTHIKDCHELLSAKKNFKGFHQNSRRSLFDGNSQDKHNNLSDKKITINNISTSTKADLFNKTVGDSSKFGTTIERTGWKNTTDNSFRITQTNHRNDKMNCNNINNIFHNNNSKKSLKHNVAFQENLEEELKKINAEDGALSQYTLNRQKNFMNDNELLDQKYSVRINTKANDLDKLNQNQKGNEHFAENEGFFKQMVNKVSKLKEKVLVAISLKDGTCQSFTYGTKDMKYPIKVRIFTESRSQMMIAISFSKLPTISNKDMIINGKSLIIPKKMHYLDIRKILYIKIFAINGFSGHIGVASIGLEAVQRIQANFQADKITIDHMHEIQYVLMDEIDQEAQDLKEFMLKDTLKKKIETEPEEPISNGFSMLMKEIRKEKLIKQIAEEEQVLKDLEEIKKEDKNLLVENFSKITPHMVNEEYENKTEEETKPKRQIEIKITRYKDDMASGQVFDIDSTRHNQVSDQNTLQVETMQNNNKSQFNLGSALLGMTPANKEGDDLKDNIEDAEEGQLKIPNSEAATESDHNKVNQ